jgi:hypothetical protein
MPWVATPSEFRLELPDRRSTLFREQARDSENFRVSGVFRGLGIQRAAKPLPLPSIEVLRQTGENREDVNDDPFPAFD